jgi:glutaredoxin 3
MKKVVVYTASPCPYCSRAKDLLQRRGIAFEEIKISWEDEKAWADLLKRSGLKTVPQIFVEDKCLGGYTDIAALDQAGELLKAVNP